MEVCLHTVPHSSPTTTHSIALLTPMTIYAIGLTINVTHVVNNPKEVSNLSFTILDSALHPYRGGKVKSWPVFLCNLLILKAKPDFHRPQFWNHFRAYSPSNPNHINNFNRFTLQVPGVICHCKAGNGYINPYFRKSNAFQFQLHHKCVIMEHKGEKPPISSLLQRKGVAIPSPSTLSRRWSPQVGLALWRKKCVINANDVTSITLGGYTVSIAGSSLRSTLALKTRERRRK